MSSNFTYKELHALTYQSIVKLASELSLLSGSRKKKDLINKIINRDQKTLDFDLSQKEDEESSEENEGPQKDVEDQDAESMHNETEQMTVEEESNTSASNASDTSNSSDTVSNAFTLTSVASEGSEEASAPDYDIDSVNNSVNNSDDDIDDDDDTSCSSTEVGMENAKKVEMQNTMEAKSLDNEPCSTKDAMDDLGKDTQEDTPKDTPKDTQEDTVRIIDKPLELNSLELNSLELNSIIISYRDIKYYTKHKFVDAYGRTCYEVVPSDRPYTTRYKIIKI